MANSSEYKTSTPTVLILVFLLVCLVILLILFYKKLNKESEGKYTIRRMVYKEGGLRDRVRGAAVFLGDRLGVQLWPNSESGEDGEEMQEFGDEEGQTREHSSQGCDNEEDEQEEEEDNVEQSGERNGNRDDTSGDISSFFDSDMEERASLMDQLDAKGETGEKGEEKGGDGDGKGETSGGAGLQITLSHLSGSANWSAGEGGVSDVTAL